MKLVTQDGRVLDVSPEADIVYYDDGRMQEIFIDHYYHREGYLGTYGYWVVAEFVANDIVTALETGKAEFKMPPYMHTAKEYHNYKEATA